MKLLECRHTGGGKICVGLLRRGWAGNCRLVRSFEKLEQGSEPFGQYTMAAGLTVLLTAVMFGNNKLMFPNGKSLRHDGRNVVLNRVECGRWKATNNIIKEADRVYELQGRA